MVRQTCNRFSPYLAVNVVARFVIFGSALMLKTRSNICVGRPASVLKVPLVSKKKNKVETEVPTNFSDERHLTV